MNVPPAEGYPRLDTALDALLSSVLSRMPDHAHIDPSAILLVAGGAHGGIVASVRSLGESARTVRVADKERLWEIALRPRFFWEGDASQRLGTLFHELLHLDPARPGALLEEARHHRRSHEEHERLASTLAEAWLSGCSPSERALLAPLGHHGVVWMRQWKFRPVREEPRRAFGDADLFLGPLWIQTPRPLRSVWW